MRREEGGRGGDAALRPEGCGGGDGGSRREEAGLKPAPTQEGAGDWLGGLGAVGFVVRHGPPTDSGPAHHEGLVRPWVMLRGSRDPSGYLGMTEGELGMTRGAS